MLTYIHSHFFDAIELRVAAVNADQTHTTLAVAPFGHSALRAHIAAMSDARRSKQKEQKAAVPELDQW
jgi:hypothetical protein